MNESILTSVKKLLGIAESYEHFDLDIVTHINAVFSILTQLGVGPPQGFSIINKSSVWSDFLGESSTEFESVKSYVAIKVRLMFDPPISSSALDSMTRIVEELEWRLNLSAE